MKIIITILLVLVLVLLPSPCSAPTPGPQPNFVSVAELVLAITVIAVGATAVYVIIKCAKKLDRPPVIEKSTNRVDWSESGKMKLVADGWEYRETNSSPATFYRAKLP